MTEKKLHGTVIFWRNTWGFIEVDDSERSLFFHISHVSHKNGEIGLLSRVSFREGVSTYGRHQGKPCATDIEVLGKASFDRYHRTVGIVTEWHHSSYGYLKSRQLDKSVFLYKTRLIECQAGEIKKGQYLVCAPVKSRRDDSEYFALFAYPVEKETDVAFLYEQFHSNNPEAVRKQIYRLLPETQAFSPEEKIDIAFEITNSMMEVVPLLVHIHNAHLQSLPIEPLYQKYRNGQLNSERLLFLLTEKVIDDLPVEVAHQLIEEHLLQEIKARSKSEDIEKSYAQNIVEGISGQTFTEVVKLQMQAWQSLWEIRQEDLDFAKCFLNLLNENHEKLPHSLYEQVIHFAFDNFPLQIIIPFKQALSPVFQKVIHERLSPKERLILSVTSSTSLAPELMTYFDSQWQELDIYLRLLLLRKNKDKIDKDAYEAIKASITQEAIYTFVQTYPWQNPKTYDYPLDAIDLLSLLQEECDYSGTQLREVAEFIYNVIPAYTVQHVRLWLYGWVDIGYFNRAGFSLPYKSLTSEEQARFKQLSDEYELRQTIEKIKKSTLELSGPAALSTGSTSVYQADIRHLYFEYKQVSVIYQNSKLSYPCPDSTDAYNHLREVSELQQIPLGIHISEDKIESIDNLDRLLMLIHQHKEHAAFDNSSNSPVHRAAARENLEVFYDLASDDFQVAEFSAYKSQAAGLTRNADYTENWEVRAKISEYLSGLQAPGIMPVLIKRTTIKNDEDEIEETALFSIPTYDGYAIVWHNLDYTKNKADYIFKTSKERHPQTLLNIIKAIKSIKNIRSTLSANLDNDNYIILMNGKVIDGLPYEYEKKLTIFRRSLGYVGRILKNRRSNTAFEDWRERFHELLEKDIPPVPTAEEQELIKDIENLEIKRAPRSTPIVKYKSSISLISNRPVWTKDHKETWESKKTEVKKIDNKLKTVSDDIIMEKPFSHAENKNTPHTQEKKQKLKRILNLLEDINKLLDID